MFSSQNPETEHEGLTVGCFINVPRHLESFQLQGSSERSPYCEAFEDGSGFVFNPESPNGVVYLTHQAFTIYRALLAEAGGRPKVDPLNGPLYNDLVRSGIATSVAPITKTTRPHPARRQFSVWFHISNACNLSCRYCYIPHLEKAVDIERMGDQFMSPSTIEESTRSLISFCIEKRFNSLNIKFAGGEPTLRVPLLVETCDIARRLASESGINVTFSMLSNGVFIDDAVFEFIKKYNVNLSISIDGDKATHDRVRFTISRSDHSRQGKPRPRYGTWDIIADNITKLRAAGISPYILCTVTSENYTTLKGLAEHTISWGIGMRLSLVRDRRSHLTPGLSEGILVEMADLYRWLGQHMPISMPIERFAGFAEWKPSAKKVGVCGACRSSAALDQNGAVASCQMRMDKPWGSVKEEPFASIFQRMRTEEDNRYLVNPEARTAGCSICYWKYTCAGGCPEHTRLAEDTQNTPSPWCKVYQDLLPHYLRSIATQMKRRVEQPSHLSTSLLS